MSAKKKATVPNLPDGWFDIVPDDQRYWHHVWRRTNGLLADYSFNRLDLAPAELAETFTRPVEDSNPDRAKSLVVARTQGLQLALRADLISSVMRTYLQYGMHTQPHPVKMFTSAPVVVPSDRGSTMHWQLGAVTIGDDSEAVDAELLFLGCRVLEALNLGPFVVRINTIGDPLGRPAYLRALRDFFKANQKKVSARVHALTKEHPFWALSVLAVELPELAKEAPQSVDYLSDESRLFFKRLLEFLDEGQVPYLIDHTLLSTDDCASHTVWEFLLDATPEVPATETRAAVAAQPAQVILRGGRLDRLAESLGGPKTPAAAWSMDMDAIITRLKAKGVEPAEVGARPKVFLSQLGEAAKKRSLMLFEEIRKSGIEVRYSLSRDTIKGQLRMAARYGVRFALIFGQKEALEGTVILREMETGVQETIPQEKIIGELKKRLKNS
jgi:histidyl-tRNA synthetase